MTEEQPMAMDQKDMTERVHALEVAQATQTATLGGAQATQAAMHAGTWSTYAAGSVGLIVGIFLGLAIAALSRAQRV
jgi:hypothetical protein